MLLTIKPDTSQMPREEFQLEWAVVTDVCISPKRFKFSSHVQQHILYQQYCRRIGSQRDPCTPQCCNLQPRYDCSKVSGILLFEATCSYFRFFQRHVRDTCSQVNSQKCSSTVFVHIGPLNLGSDHLFLLSKPKTFNSYTIYS